LKNKKWTFLAQNTDVAVVSGADPEILIRGWANRGGVGCGMWECPLPPKKLDFASQMATFGAFWALSFTVWMHV